MRLKDVANVSLGADDYETQVALRRQAGGLYRHPGRAGGQPARRDRAACARSFPTSTRSCRSGLQRRRSSTIRPNFVNSCDPRGGARRLVEALLIVTLVVFLFLGSLRAVLIPMVAIPLSLVGTFTMMLALGFSINLLTLLALVLAIGLVVDDAIIVVENVNRHLEEGMTPIRGGDRRRRASLAGRSSR